MRERRAKKSPRSKPAHPNPANRRTNAKSALDPGEKVTRLFVNAMALLVSDPEKFLMELMESFVEIAGDESSKLAWIMELDKSSENMKLEQGTLIISSGDERLLPLLGILAEDEDPEVRKIVAAGIKNFPTGSAIPILSTLISDKDSEVRKLARASLSALKKQGIDISLVFAPLPAEERPLHSCYINKSWRELGIASIIIARRTGPGKLKFACFLIDRWGKGLKDVFGNIDFPEDKFKTEVIPMYGLSGQKLVPFDISMARKLVWSALEFTRKSGFSEPPDFKYWKDLPGILSDAERMEPVLAFDGQNFFLDEVADLVQESGGGKSKK